MSVVGAVRIWQGEGRRLDPKEQTINCARVDGAGLTRLTGLRSLDVPGSAFTDADLVHLKGLTRLERLNLSDTAVTDAGLVHVQALINLDRCSTCTSRA